jgi:anti-sigma regulatory factor (Ser/Thr protein kinase)
MRRSFEPIAGSIRGARSFAVDAAGLTDGSEAAERLALVVSELASNAVLHAGTPYSVSVVRTNGRVHVSVHDDGGAAQLEPLELNRANVTGRGLRIVAAVADEWGSDRDADGVGKNVWAELVLDAASGAPSNRAVPT